MNPSDEERQLRAAIEIEGLALDRELLEELYRELRRVASNHLRRERAGHTLRTTALANEAWVRLAQRRPQAFRDRGHLLASVSLLVRRILVDHARSRAGRRRAEDERSAPSTEVMVCGLGDDDCLDLLALDDALLELEAREQRLARVVDLRYFGGLSIEQAAQVLSVSPATVKRDWELARAWLYRRLRGTRS